MMFWNHKVQGPRRGRSGADAGGQIEQLEPRKLLAAEVMVLGNGQEIADGDIRPAVADHTAFRNRDVDGETRTRSFTIRNDGDEQLDLAGLALSGRNAAEFELIDPSGGALGPGESMTFEVRFNPDTPGRKIANVTIANNDPDEGDYSFRINGRGTEQSGPPEIVVFGLLPIADGTNRASVLTGTNFGPANPEIGQSRLRTFTITNLGFGSLTLSSPFVRIAGRNSGDFHITAFPEDTELRHGESAFFTVFFTPLSVGRKNAVIQIFSNDADEAVYNFKINGLGQVNPG